MVFSAVRRFVVAGTGIATLVWAGFFYFRPEVPFGFLGRPVLDPVIARQYGLFLAATVPMYAICAWKPSRYRSVIWIALAQRFAELTVAVIDWRSGELPPAAFALLAGVEVVVAALLLCCSPSDTLPARFVSRESSDLRLRRALIAFGGLQLFWALLSTIFVQLGTRVLNWKLQDAYTTQQQGIALLVIGLTSLLAASDLRRYRPLIWVAVSSQGLGIINAINELHLRTISLTGALVQWTIETAIIATLLGLSQAERRAIDHGSAIVSPLGEA